LEQGRDLGVGGCEMLHSLRVAGICPWSPFLFRMPLHRHWHFGYVQQGLNDRLKKSRSTVVYCGAGDM
jgi:hypothetical protein